MLGVEEEWRVVCVTAEGVKVRGLGVRKGGLEVVEEVLRCRAVEMVRVLRIAVRCSRIASVTLVTARRRFILSQLIVVL